MPLALTIDHEVACLMRLPVPVPRENGLHHRGNPIKSADEWGRTALLIINLGHQAETAINQPQGVEG
jgi:hypothetical protein